MKQKIRKTEKNSTDIRFSLTSVVALLILLSVFISSTLSYSRYTRDFQEQSSEQIDQTLEQLSINLSTYLDELFRLTVYLYYDDSVVAALEATGGSDIDRLQRRRVIESYLDKIMIMPRKDILNVFVITDDIYFSGRMPKSVNHSADYQALDWYQDAMSTQSPISCRLTQSSWYLILRIRFFYRQAAEKRAKHRPGDRGHQGRRQL